MELNLRVWMLHSSAHGSDWRAGQYGKLVQFVTQNENTFGVIALEQSGAFIMAPTYAFQLAQAKIEDVKYAIRRYTHDRSETGYDDVLGSCGSNCKQCAKDAPFILEIERLLG